MNSGDTKVRRPALEVYALVACLGALGFLAIYLGMGIYHFIAVWRPELTVNPWDRTRHETDEAFIEHIGYWEKKAKGEPVPPLTQIPALRHESWARALREERDERLRKFVQAAIGVLVGLSVFTIHWRIARRARESARAV